jgi:hypothetical protein
MSEEIKFYTTKGPYGCFTNYSKHPVFLPEFNHGFATSEHAYQAYKFFPHRMDLVEKIYNDPSPKASGVIGRDPKNPMRSDWEQPISKSLILQYQNVLPEYFPDLELTKDLLMYVVLWHKALGNKDFKEILLGTGDAVIIEDSPIDGYWGNKDNGKNKLGKCLMLLRNHLRSVFAK